MSGPYPQPNSHELDADQRRAINKAANSARRYLLSARAFRARVTQVTSARLQYARALHEVEPKPTAPTRFEVLLEPDKAVRVLHPNGADPADFDRPPATHPGQLLEDQQLLTTDLPQSLRPTLESGERVRQSRLQRFEQRVHRVAYRLPGFGHAVIIVADSTPAPLSSSDFAPLKRRRSTILAVSGAALIGVLIVATI